MIQDNYLSIDDIVFFNLKLIEQSGKTRTYKRDNEVYILYPVTDIKAKDIFQVINKYKKDGYPINIVKKE